MGAPEEEGDDGGTTEENVGRQHLLPLGNFRGSPFILSPFILKIMFPHSGDDGLVISPLVVELAEEGDRVIATLSVVGGAVGGEDEEGNLPNINK